MPDFPQITIKGLATYPNPLGSAPQGSLVVADNIVIDADGTAQSRRGFSVLPETFGTGSSRANKLFSFQGQLLAQYDNGTFAYRVPNVGWTTYSGSYPPPDSNTAKTRSVESNSNFYFTSSTGVQKLDLYTNPIQAAGGINGLDIQGTASTAVGGFLPASVSTLQTFSGNTVNGTTTILNVSNAAELFPGQYISGSGIPSSPPTTILTINTTNATFSTTGNTTSGSASLSSLASTTGIAVGQSITGTGIPSGTFVSSLSGSTVTMSQNATATGTGVAVTFGNGDIITISQSATATANSVTVTPYNGSQVAYRMVWGYTDANKNEILGVPSQRAVVSNNSGSAANVSLTFTIPAAVTTNWFYQIYRSGLFDLAAPAGISITPDDELGLVYEANPSNTDLSNGFITFTDLVPDALRGTTIYTAASQEGILQSNYSPPFCKDLAVFKSCALYANTSTKWNLNLTLLAANGSSGVNFVQTTGNTTSGSNQLTSVGTTTGVAVGQLITGTGIPASTTVSSISGSTVTMSHNATATNTGISVSFADQIIINGVTYTAGSAENSSTGTFLVSSSGSPAQNVTATAESLVRVINKYSANTTLYAYYMSGVTDLPGKIYLENRTFGGSSWAVTCPSAHGATAFNPTLPTSGTSVSSSQNVQKNAVFCSKVQQPEAVPLVNVFYAGSAAFDILRIIPLRDSVFILKQDGIFRLVGNDPSDFYITLFDDTTQLLAPDSAVNLNNTIYCLSNQGVVSISDTGVRVVSRDIEGDLLTIFGANLTSVQNLTFGVSYQSDRKYILGIISSAGDSTPTQLYVYNLFTNAWTRWPLAKTCGLVNIADNMLYFGDAVTNTINQERKSYSYTDYVDGSFAVTISSFSGTTVNLTSTAGVSVGDLLYQSAGLNSVITAVGVGSVTTANPIGWTIGAATVFAAINCVVQFQPQAGTAQQATEFLKQFSEVELFFKKARFPQATLGFFSDLSQSTDSLTLAGVSANGAWGLFPWGSVYWGGAQQPVPLRTYVPKNKQRCSQLSMIFTHRSAYGDFQLNGFNLKVRPVSERTSK